MQPDEKTQKVAQDISETIDKEDDSVQVEPAAPTVKPETEKSATGGYALGDLAKAPARPPQPHQTESREFTANRKVFFIIIAAVVLFLFGIFLAVFGYTIPGILLIIAAAILTLVAVFLPIR